MMLDDAVTALQPEHVPRSVWAGAMVLLAIMRVFFLVAFGVYDTMGRAALPALSYIFQPSASCTTPFASKMPVF